MSCCPQRTLAGLLRSAKQSWLSVLLLILLVTLLLLTLLLLNQAAYTKHSLHSSAIAVVLRSFVVSLWVRSVLFVLPMWQDPELQFMRSMHGISGDPPESHILILHDHAAHLSSPVLIQHMGMCTCSCDLWGFTDGVSCDHRRRGAVAKTLTAGTLHAQVLLSLYSLFTMASRILKCWAGYFCIFLVVLDPT